MMISSDEFDQLVRSAWQDLLRLIPDDLKRHLDHVVILIEDAPSSSVLDDLASGDKVETELARHPDELCGLHVGVPLTQESLTQPHLFPVRVYLFRKALMREAAFDGTPEGYKRLRQEINITLIHEIGHFFGLDEDDLDRLGFA